MSSHDQTYQRLLNDVVLRGTRQQERTGTGTYAIFGTRMEFNLRSSFPLLTSKKIHWKSVVHELLWMMSGSTNVKDLHKHGVTIWDEWADPETGDLGPVYGAQWRFWEGPMESDEGGSYPGKRHDQLGNLIRGLRDNPTSRRHIISAWNVGELDQMALPPCHCLVQFFVQQDDNSLHCQLYQRSADVFLGVPFNIASYSLLTCILADKLGFRRGSFTWVGGDTHLYENHIEQAIEQLDRRAPASPILLPMSLGDPLDVTFDEIVIEDYNPLPSIKAPVAV